MKKNDFETGVYAYAISPPDTFKPLEDFEPFDWREHIPKTFEYGKKKMKDIYEHGERICKVCGQSESDHHEFQPVQIPEKCVCEWQAWRNINNILEICGNFEPMANEPELCKNCEHEEGCHK